MIRLFDKDETNFGSNGLGVLDSEIKENVVEEKMNGIYNFDFAYLSKGEHASQLEGDMIIKAPTPDGDQLFRVYKVTKNIGFLEVSCYHIFYDLAGNFIEDTNIVSQSGQAAITHFGTGLQYATRFNFVSNIVGTNSARMVRLNAVQALLDSSQDNSFLSRWGGEIKRDNFTVYMNDVRGNDKGFKIRHGKNLTGYEANIDYSTVVTRIMPYGYNGLMLPEKYVDSPLRDKYAFTRIKKIEYTNIKAIDPDATSNDESAVPLEEAHKLLRQAAELEYSVNKVDIPTSNFKVTFKNLSDTKEYADFKALEKVDPWDYVTVIADNLDIKSRMISYKYDAITKAYKEVELGNYVPSFTDIVSKVDHATNLANQANDTANTAAESANGKNSNYYGPSEPSRPVDGDLWYKKNGDKTELWQYDGKSVPPGWKLVVDDATGEEVRQNVDAAQKEAEEAKKTANESVSAANNAVAKADFANDTATQAKSDAAAAGQQAKDALTSAGTAITDAQTAQSDAATAKIQATNAATQANQAVTDATAAKGQAANALGQANTAINNAANALDKFNNMSVGGRNYLLGSATVTPVDNQHNWNVVANKSTDTFNGLTVTEGVSAWSGMKYSLIWLYATAPINLQDEYTTSIWVRNTSTQDNVPIRFYCDASDKSGTLATYLPAKSDWVRISQTFRFNKTSDQLTWSMRIRFENFVEITTGDGFIQQAGFKLEKGNQATDWTPAPEDVQQQFTNIDGELASKVSQTTYNVLAGTVDTVSTLAEQNQSTISNLATKTSVDTVNHTATTAQTLAQQNANELLNKANSTTVNTLTQRVTTAESTLKQTATTAQLALTQKDIDDINDTVTTQGLDITAMADGLKLKSDATTVNALSQTVDKQSSQLALTATKAELGLTQTNVDNLKKTVTSNTAGMTANANALKLKADSSTVSSLDGRVTNLSGQLDVQADKIAATVTANDVTGMLDGYATQTWAQSQIKVTADGINSTLSSVQTQVQNSAVGTNLYTNTKNFDNLASWSAFRWWTKTTDAYKGLSVVQTTADWTGLSQYVQVKKGDILTYSVYAKNTSGTGTSQISWQLDPQVEGSYSTATVNQKWNTVTITDSWQKVSGTAVATSDGYLRPRIERTPNNTNTLQIAGIKVEKGSVATDWCPNPADNATVTAVSKISQTVDGIQTTVSGKADQSQVTQLAGQITSVVTSTANPNLIMNGGYPTTTEHWAGATDFAVTKHGFYRRGNLFLLGNVGTLEQNIGTDRVKVVAGAKYTISMIIFGGANVSSYDVWFLGRKNGSTANFDTSVLVAGAKKPNPNAAEHPNWTFSMPDVDEGYIRIDNNGTTNAPNKAGLYFTEVKLEKGTMATPYIQSAESSEIIQTKEMINLRVQKGDVINQINISPESILIAGQKVHITGQTSIDNAVIKDAMIADIKADKITAGTLNAANVNVINLNANNITTGTLKGTNLSMNLNTGEVLFQKGSIKSSDGTFAVDIDNRTITSTDDSHNGIVLKHGELHFYKEINAGSGSAEFGRMDVAYLNGGGLSITGYNGLNLGTEFTGLYEANLTLVSPKYNSGKSSAALVGDVIYLQSSLGKAEIIISGKTDISGNTSVIGDFDVLGKKNAIHLTNDGIRETPAYETAESYLGDIGEGVTDESGRALIHIDALFNQIINTDYDYQVFVSSYSNAIVWVEEREKASFEIHSNISNAKFAWEIKAKRRGYETDRLVKSEMKYERLNKFHEKKVSA